MTAKFRLRAKNPLILLKCVNNKVDSDFWKSELASFHSTGKHTSKTISILSQNLHFPLRGKTQSNNLQNLLISTSEETFRNRSDLIQREKIYRKRLQCCYLQKFMLRSERPLNFAIIDNNLFIIKSGEKQMPEKTLTTGIFLYELCL